MTLFKIWETIEATLYANYRRNLCPLTVGINVIKGAHWADICVLYILLLVFFFFFVVNISSFSLKRILSLIPVLHLMNLSQWLKFPFFAFVCSAFGLCCFLVLHLSLAVMVCGCRQTCMTWSHGYTCALILPLNVNCFR